MEFDYSQVIVPVGGAITYPDYVFEAQPVPPDKIKDSAYIVGNASDRGGITGSASSQGQLGY